MSVPTVHRYALRTGEALAISAGAAYALCCACSRILAPPSGIVGSVGVISTMVSIAARDEREGMAFRVITSGKRKADGHLHVPITDDAVRAETARNNELAAQFFALAGGLRRGGESAYVGGTHRGVMPSCGREPERRLSVRAFVFLRPRRAGGQATARRATAGSCS